MDNIKIIAIGNKARQGKDVFAALLQKKLTNAFTLSWAMPLKEEVSQKTEIPLIFKRHANGKDYYYLRDTLSNYRVFTAEQMPLLHTMFTTRGISEYYIMKEKDPVLLQVWGTDFRRKIEDLYWVNRVDTMIKNISASLNGEKGYVLIPDTRFFNEYSYVMTQGGLYVRVLRLEDSGMQYIDPERDSKHQSETELDTAPADFTVIAKTGDMKSIEKHVDTFIKTHL